VCLFILSANGSESSDVVRRVGAVAWQIFGKTAKNTPPYHFSSNESTLSVVNAAPVWGADRRTANKR